jgi:hypothetical protein
MLIEYSRETFRGQIPASHLTDDLTVPLTAIPGLVFPGFNAVWKVFGTYKIHTCVELAGGLIPISAWIAASIQTRGGVMRKLRWEMGLALSVLMLCLLPSPGNFRWSFRWLPLLMLTLSLVGAHCLATLYESQSRRGLSCGAWAGLLVLITCLSNLWFLPNPAYPALEQGAALIATCAIWALCDTVVGQRSRWYKTVPGVATLVVAVTTYLPVESALEFPVWRRSQLTTSRILDPARRYLSIHEWPDVFISDRTGMNRPIADSGRDFVPGNFNQYIDVEFVNGYSPMWPVGLSELFRFGPHGYLGAPNNRGNQQCLEPVLRLVEAEAGSDGFLAIMGVDGVLISDRHAELVPKLLAQGWTKEARLRGSTLLHRQMTTKHVAQIISSASVTNDWANAVEQVRMGSHGGCRRVVYVDPSTKSRTEPSKFAPASIHMSTSTRHTASVEVTTLDSAGAAAMKETLVVFSRPWFPGYRAEFQGRELSVDRFNLILPAVRLPAGESGKLTLRYLPASLVQGCLFATLTVTCLVAIAVWDWKAMSAGRNAPTSATCR